MRISGLERFLTVIGYLPILPWVLLGALRLANAKRDSMFVQFHLRQSAVLSLLWLSVLVVAFIVLVVAPALQIALFSLMALATLGFAVFMLFGMFKCALGERYRMPGVADVALMLRL